jgi:hypothetical protein
LYTNKYNAVLLIKNHVVDFLSLARHYYRSARALGINMDNSEIPFVAVIGGLWKLDAQAHAHAHTTANEIGVELAKAGFGLVVYYSSSSSLEPHVVSGFVGAQSGNSAVIRVRYAESQRGKVRFIEEDDRPELFEHRLFPGEDWEAPFYRSLAEEEGVNAVLLLGGATSTLIAGQIAVARRLPILAVDEFGGSAAKIWNQLAQASPDKNFHSWGRRPPAAFVAELKKECTAIAIRRSEAQRREQIYAKITGQAQKRAYGLGAFVCLIAALFFGMVYTPYPPAHALITLAGLISAGATGAVARLLLWGPSESDPRTSALLGSIAGFTVGLAYLIPQWVGAPAVLEAKAASVSATDKIQFASAVLVAISAGVGFDTIFNRLNKQAEGAAISPPH